MMGVFVHSARWFVSTADPLYDAQAAYVLRPGRRVIYLDANAINSLKDYMIYAALYDRTMQTLIPT